MIQGITIKLKVKIPDGKDELNRETFREEWTEIHNVLVGEPSSSDITDTFNLTGKIVNYVMAIPKGDTHEWEDTEVILPYPFNQKFRTVGYATAGIEENIPLLWNKKVKISKS